jgi:hypothetical protein
MTRPVVPSIGEDEALHGVTLPPLPPPVLVSDRVFAQCLRSRKVLVRIRSSWPVNVASTNDVESTIDQDDPNVVSWVKVPFQPGLRSPALRPRR